MKERIQWIDTAKFLGIFAIYLGHFGDVMGNAYYFVFLYHVPLFFFISGCLCNYDKKSDFIGYGIKKFQLLLLPLWGFGIVSIILKCLAGLIKGDFHISFAKDMLGQLLKGCIRNHFVAGSLWFLSCLFLVEILFKLIRYAKYRWMIAVICLVIYCAVEKFLSPHPLASPSGIYNWDSALYYLIFYASGYLAYPWISQLFTLGSRIKKVIFFVTGGLAFVYSALIYLGRDGISPLMETIPGVGIFLPVIKPLVIIWLNLVVSKLLEKIEFLNQIGRETLFLCGNEYLIKNVLPYALTLFGAGQFLLSPFTTFLYTFILLVIGTKLLIPCEKKVIALVLNRFKRCKD